MWSDIDNGPESPHSMWPDIEIGSASMISPSKSVFQKNDCQSVLESSKSLELSDSNEWYGQRPYLGGSEVAGSGELVWPR